MKKTVHNRRLAQWRVIPKQVRDRLWFPDSYRDEHSTSHQLLWCIDSFPAVSGQAVLQKPIQRKAWER
jgi:hypothetical protein